MFRFGFKKKWKSNKDSNEPEQPQTTNGIKLLTFRAIDNEFTPRTPAPEYAVQRRTRVKRNVLEVFRQSYPNYAIRNGEEVSQKPVQFETVRPPKETPNHIDKTNSGNETEERSTLIFMTEDHGDAVRGNDPIDDEFEVNLGAAFQQRIQIDEAVPSVEQEQELEDIYSARNPRLQDEGVELRSQPDRESIEDGETVVLGNETSEFGDDNFKIHVAQHAHDAASMFSYKSGDTLLDTESVLQEERPNFRFDDYYDFGESQTDVVEETEEVHQMEEFKQNYETESDEEINFRISDKNGNNDIEQDEETETIEQDVQENIQEKQEEKRVMFDVSVDDEENSRKAKIKGQIISTPIRKETLEDIKMKPGYSLQASALFFSGDNDGNDSETSA